MENIIIKQYKPKKLSNYIERISFGYAKTNDVNHFQIPLPFNPWVIPLNDHGFYYNDDFFDKPIVQNISLVPATYKMPQGSQMLLVRFYPGSFYPFWDFSLKKYQPILDFIPNQEDCEDPERLEICLSQIYDYLDTKFSQSRADKVNIIKDLYQYIINNPESTIESFCDEREIKYMSLYRLFGNKLNMTPMKFVRLCKFRVANYHLFHSSKSLTGIGSNSGYYDQPHFVKEFKHFVGVTPKEYIQIIKQNEIYSSSAFKDFSLLYLDI
ncbi:helix-turn-helix domain-containing protein [Reichenbachiella versicolor]|uniref:helix-turn-helix domain-containing protein n=1 Tax=Reichenbachiella versicolor TaxID=1821036 RepID=UPI000D6DFED7|nr:AraC family transcriptional regulator [Reichenbachiella versicolor]